MICLLFFIACLYGNLAHAIIIGSNVTNSRNAFVTFPAADDDNEIIGFCVMDSGFALEDLTTTLTFDSFFAVRKRIELNRGTVFLKTDLMLDNIKTFTSLGSIRAVDETRFLAFPPSLRLLGDDSANPVTFEQLELIMKSDVRLTSPIIFEGTNVINGSGKILDLGANGGLIVAAGSSLTLHDIIITGIESNKIRCADNSANLILAGMQWVQSAYSFFDTGSIIIQDTVTFSGTSTFEYESAYTSTIGSESEWRFSNGIVFRTGKHPISQVQPLGFVDNSSYIVFDNCDFQVTNQGLILTKGKARLARTVFFNLESTSTANGLILGTNIADQDFRVEFDPSVELHSIKGHVVYNNFRPDLFVSFSKDGKVTRSVDANFFVAQNLILSRITIENPSLLTPSIQVATGKTLTFDDVRVVVPTVEFEVTGRQFNMGTLLLTGNGLLSVRNGIMPLALLMQSTGNVIRGNGIHAGPIVFSNAAVTATWSLNGSLNSSLTLNNATLSLASNLLMDVNASLVGPGVIDLNGLVVKLPPVRSNWVTPIKWDGGYVLISENTTLMSTWTFSGNCELDGTGYLLSMGTNGQIVVDSNSSLVLHNIFVDQLAGNNIRCLDDSGVIILNNASLVLGDDYNFTHGAFQCKHRNKITGDHVFAYQSQMTSTVLYDSNLVLSQNITFSYDPIINAKGLIEFIDQSSELTMNRSTIHTTTVGMRFQKGRLVIENDSRIESETAFVSTSTDENPDMLFIDEGITLGDGINASNDFYVQISSGVTLDMAQGSLIIRNFDPQAFSLINSYATLHMLSFTSLLAYQNIIFSIGRIIFEDQTTLGIVPGNIFQASISPFGSLHRLSLTP